MKSSKIGVYNKSNFILPIFLKQFLGNQGLLDLVAALQWIQDNIGNYYNN